MRDTKNALLKFDQISEDFKSPRDIEKQRELLTANLIKKYVPRTFSTGSGEIFDSDGNRTGQVDVVICNQYHPFTYAETEPGLFFAEGVSCAIEVKPDLGDYSELQRGFTQIQKIKRLRRKSLDGDLTIGNDYTLERMEKIISIIFGYRSPSFRYLLPNIRRLYDELEIPQEEQVDVIVSLPRGIIYNIKDPRDDLNIEIQGQRALGFVAHITENRTLE